VIATLVKHLIIKREEKSYVIQVGYESRDPVRAAQLTNALAKLFLAEEIGRKQDSHLALLATLEDRVHRLEDRYHIDEQAEYDFTVASGLIHRGDNNSMKQQLISLSADVAEARRRTIEARNHAEMLAAQPNTLDGTSDVLGSPLLQRLRERYVQLSTGAGSNGVPFGGAGPVIASLQQAIDAEAQHLLRAAQNDAAVAEANKAALQAAVSKIDLSLTQWRINERRRDELHRVVVTSLTALNEANRRFMTEAGRGDVLQADVEIVAPAAVPDRPSSPNPLLYAAGTIALIVLLCGIVLLPTMLQRQKAYAV
jgi:polysaccharide biosynthesis transport protein